MGVKNLQKKLNLLEADIASHQVTRFICLSSLTYVRPMFNSLNILVSFILIVRASNDKKQS